MLANGKARLVEFPIADGHRGQQWVANTVIDMALRAPKICYSAARLLNLLCSCTLVGGEALGDSSASTANFNCITRFFLRAVIYLT